MNSDRTGLVSKLFRCQARPVVLVGLAGSSSLPSWCEIGVWAVFSGAALVTGAPAFLSCCKLKLSSDMKRTGASDPTTGSASLRRRRKSAKSDWHELPTAEAGAKVAPEVETHECAMCNRGPSVLNGELIDGACR